jgi:ABC-type multidrug transport system fused ATPase/permease subunit
MKFVSKITYLLSRKNKKKLVILFFLLFLGMLFELLGLGILIPILNLVSNPNSSINKYILNNRVIQNLAINNHEQLVLFVMFILIFIYFIKTGFLIFLAHKQSRFTSSLSAELSRNLFEGYLRQPYSFHLNRNSSELQRNVQAEVANFNNASQVSIALFLELIIIIGIIIFLIIIQPFAAFTIVFSLFFMTYIFYILTKKKLMHWGQRRLDFSAYSTLHLNQGLSGVKEVKLLGKESFFVDKFSHYNNEISNIQAKISTINLVPRLYLEFVSVIALAFLIIFFTIRGMEIGALLPILGVFVAAAFRLVPSVNRIIGSIQIIKTSQPVIDLLYNEFRSIEDNDSNNKQSSNSFLFKKDIKLIDIIYSYGTAKQPELDKINLKIHKGGCIGIIGTSGSGKSTLIDVLLGLLTPQSGSIYVDNELLNTKNIRSWQKIIGYVPQVIYLTDNSLKSNIAFGIPDDEIDNILIERAIESAQLTDLVNSIPEGVETAIGERGVRLSGGQRQRIGIARALYHDPQILVLDEATSALDNDTESDVMLSINKLLGEKTIIIVAHRLSTIQNCDQVYKLENGIIVDQFVPNEIII